jgi:hypothetical protein
MDAQGRIGGRREKGRKGERESAWQKEHWAARTDVAAAANESQGGESGVILQILEF